MNIKMKKLFLGLYLFAGFASTYANQDDNYEDESTQEADKSVNLGIYGEMSIEEIMARYSKLSDNFEIFKEIKDELEQRLYGENKEKRDETERLLRETVKVLEEGQQDLQQKVLDGQISLTPATLMEPLYYWSDTCMATPYFFVLVIRSLVDCGLDINQQFTVHETCFSGQRLDSDLKQYNTSTLTYLMYYRSDASIVRSLLACGANPLIKNNQGKTVFDFLCPDVESLGEATKAFPTPARTSWYYLSCDSFYALLQAVEEKDRHDLMRQYLPLSKLNSSLPFIMKDSGEVALFENTEFINVFFAVLPTLENAQNFIKDYLNSLESEQERQKFKTDMNDYLVYLNSEEALKTAPLFRRYAMQALNML